MRKAARHHILLIGIDDYLGDSNLRGCVNDVDALARLLTEDAGIAPAALSLLTAPLAGASRRTNRAERPATRQNILQALRDLADPHSERDGGPVQLGDRVLIHYSGHGDSEPDLERRVCFEAIAPMDFATAGLLYDYELNPLLTAIANRCGDLTVILDSCFAAGATRSASAPAATPRCLRSARRPPRVTPPLPAATRSGLGSAPAMADAPLLVLAACQSSEIANEVTVPIAETKRHHGALTYALVTTLGRYAPADLPTVRWADLWEPLRAAVAKPPAGQHPVLLGRRERFILGGPQTPYDAGFAITELPTGTYRVAAGSLHGLGTGTVVAVYGAQPDRFPRLALDGSDPVRIATLVIEQTELASALASCAPGRPDAALPAGARGRMVCRGAQDPLRIAVWGTDAPLLAAVAAAAAGQLVPAAADAQVQVGAYADGRWWIGDALLGPGPELLPTRPAPLAIIATHHQGVALRPGQRVAALQTALRHYAAYAVPLQLAQQGSVTLDPSRIAVRLISCGDPAQVQALIADAQVRRAAPQLGPGHYRLGDGRDSQVCIELSNYGSDPLWMSLLLCGASGRLQVLDSDREVAGHTTELCWWKGQHGQPLAFAIPNPAAAWGIDRLVVVATKEPEVSLGRLEQPTGLQAAIDQSYTELATPRGSTPGPAVVEWTAVQTLIQLGGPASMA